MATQSLSFVTLDVFTESPYEGNPLAIVMIPPDREVNDTKLQQIAREFNLSETVFLYLNRGSDENTKNDSPASADPSEPVLEWKIRIFMTDCELPFAGHPTVGAAVYALTNLNDVGATRARFHCPAGVIEIQFNPAVCTAKMSIPHAVHLHTEAKHTIEEIRQIQPGLTDDAQIREAQVFSPVAGMNFLNVELASLQALAAITTTPTKPVLKLDGGWDHGFCATLFYVKIGNDHVRTRMIAGSWEDPATGAASCGLGAMLALQQRSSKTTTLKLTQGVEMGRRSEIGVVTTLSDNWEGVENIELCGTAVQVMHGSVRG
jgi:PhzF family phenazine biosynthesis protein